MSNKIESHQIFHIARKVLSESEMYSIFGKTTRYITMWAADPKCCEVTRRNPLDQARLFFDALDDHGRRDVVAAAMEYMVGNTGFDIRDELPCCSDKGSVDGEIGDVAVAVGNLITHVRAAVADKEMSIEERILIKKTILSLFEECRQLLDAAGIKGGA